MEADRIPVNLSRFNLYYPEKREFFLEGNGNFDFNLGNNSTVFYSRTIGIESLRSVPILGGARLFGKVGNSNIGALSIETGEADQDGAHIPNTNNSVLRYKYDIGGQSSIGGIFTSHINTDETSQVVGLDGGYKKIGRASCRERV